MPTRFLETFHNNHGKPEKFLEQITISLGHRLHSLVANLDRGARASADGIKATKALVESVGRSVESGLSAASRNEEGSTLMGEGRTTKSRLQRRRRIESADLSRGGLGLSANLR